jgi:hypothetical protein
VARLEKDLAAAKAEAQLSKMALSNKYPAPDNQKRMDQLLQQLSQLEEDKRTLLKEKDETKTQLLEQKDRVLEAEREAAYADKLLFLI